MIRVQKPLSHDVPRISVKSAQMTQLLAPLPDATRPSRVSPCRRSVIRCPTPKVLSCLKNVAVSQSLEELAREFARVQGQPAGREEDSETSDENGPSTCAEVRMGSVWTTTPPFAHSGRSFHVSRWKVGRIAPGAESCEDSRSTFAASCCRDGSLAVIQPLWVKKTSEFHRCLKVWRQLTPVHTQQAAKALQHNSPF